MNLQGRKVIITGAGDGIGRALALAFAKEGALVAVCARSQDRLDSLSGEIESAGHLFISADLGKVEGVEAFHESVMKQLGQVDVLINNVGAILKLANFFELTDQDWEDSFQINLMSAVRLTRLCIPSLKQSACARVINISSIAAASPQEVFPHYSAMKAGLSNFTVSLAQTLAPDQIRVNSISPGPVWSKSWEDVAREQSNGSSLEQTRKEIMEQTGKTIPLNRMGMPEDLTGLALFLASDQSAWITATNFTVDGGLTRNPF
ncbi:MAG: SDR family oxidoreductase [Nitrospinaceae bacterium]|nr:SDR family oxidoreductase [Nitrospinaceae bacterium]MEE3348254.1 SDR family oxidoreductase [Nitrospinota bacterium]